MLILFLLIIVANVISGDESDTKYIDALPENVKKGLLDRVARRILQEVPEVDSGDAEGNGDILAGKLEEQSEFVKSILKEEVESLKAKRRQASTLQNLRKSANNNDKISEHNAETSEKNEPQSNDMDSKKIVNDKIDTDAGYIDLTLRAGRAKRGDSYVNKNENTHKDSLTEDKDKENDGNNVPVALKLDDETDGKEPSKDINGNTTEVSKEKKNSAEDIQIRNIKRSVKESIEVSSKETREVVTENADNAVETTTQKNLAIDTTPKSIDSTSDSHEVNVVASEKVDLNVTPDAVNSTTIEDISTTSNSIDISSTSDDLSDSQTTENNTTVAEVDSTMANVKLNLTETTDSTKDNADHIFKYSSESFLENPIIDNKGRKNIELLHSDELVTPKKEDTSVKSELNTNATIVPVTEESDSQFTETSTLTTTEASYETTKKINQPSTQNHTDIVDNSNRDLNKEPVHFKTTEKNRKEEANESKVQEVTSTTTETDNSSQILYTNETKIRNDSKPCNQTSSKIDVKADCGDNKLNKTATKIAENEKPNITPTHIDNESRDETTVADTLKLKLKESLRDGDKKETMFDSIIHFGDMQVQKEYEVYEVDSGKPAFVKHKEKDNNAEDSIEQPQYVPIYNYDPEHAYFNAYNRLGPNDGDSENESESAEIGNVKRALRSESLRMSKILFKKKKPKKVVDYYSTTPYVNKKLECKSEEVEEVEEKKGFFLPDSNEHVHGSQSQIKNNLSAVRQAYFSNKIFGYAPSKEESKADLIAKAKYLYNNIIGNSTEEILDDDEKDKKLLRTSDDVRYDERDNASEDSRGDVNGDLGNARNHLKDDKKIKIVVVEIMKKDPSTKLRGGGYYDQRFKWDEDANTFEHKGQVYDLQDIVPYSTEKSLVLHQLAESNKIVDRFKNFGKAENGSMEDLDDLHVEDLKKAKDYLQNLNKGKFYNASSINQMKEALDRLENAIKVKKNETTNGTDPQSPRHFTFLKQRVENLLRYHKIEMQNNDKFLRSGTYNSHLKFPYEKDQFTKVKKIATEHRRKKYNATNHNNILNTIQKITQITPEIDMVKNLDRLLKVSGLPIARSGGNDDLDLYVEILKDMVKMDNRALEKYDWLGTTVAIQSALAKLKEIIKQRKRHQHIHPSDLQLLKYVEDLHIKAVKVTKDKEDEALENQLEDLKYENERNNERMALPKTHRKIKNPLQILFQISALVNKKVKRRKSAKTMRFKSFLDCLQMCLNDLHTAITEIARITKYKNQRWYKNIKELYLNKGGDKEYLEILLHLYSMRLFGLIEGSAKNGAEDDHIAYIKKNRVEVDRAEAEIIFIMRILKAIHNLKGK